MTHSQNAPIVLGNLGLGNSAENTLRQRSPGNPHAVGQARQVGLLSRDVLRPVNRLPNRNCNLDGDLFRGNVTVLRLKVVLCGLCRESNDSRECRGADGDSCDFAHSV